MRIAVIGAGIFGCTAALKLQKAGFQVTLFEEKSSIISCASRINQYRLHVGYHYPRSLETALSSTNGLESFIPEYRICLSPDWYEHYYAISAENSLVDASEYLKFLMDSKLKFEIIGNADWIDRKKIQLLIKVPEYTIDIQRLKWRIEDQIKKSGIELKLNTNFLTDEHPNSEYDIFINATYANLNYFLPESDRVDYQFEICEKPVVHLSRDWDHRSLVVLDGPFFCIDNYFPMACHIMGHVEHAIHHRNTGRFSEIPEKFRKYLNSEVVFPRDCSNFDRFKESAREFLPNLNMRNLGSMYTIRTVLPNRDHDDARPSYITKHSDRMYSIFSGKIGTCIDIANDLVKLVQG